MYEPFLLQSAARGEFAAGPEMSLFHAHYKQPAKKPQKIKERGGKGLE